MGDRGGAGGKQKGVYLGSGEALIPRGIQTGVCFGLLIVFLDQLCRLGTMVDAVKQTSIHHWVFRIRPAEN